MKPGNALKGATMSRYRYWLLRYVPNAVRGEFVNVGVIVGADEDWSIRLASNHRHMNRLGGDAGRIQPWLDRLGSLVEQSSPSTLEALDELPGLQGTRFDDLAARLNNTIQIHPGGPVATSDSARTADLLFNVFVDDPEPEHRKQKRTIVREQMTRRLEQWAQRHPGYGVHKKPRIVSASYEQDFDQLVTNAQINSPSAVTYAWSFDYSNPKSLRDKVLAWSWTVRKMRENGARASLNGGTSKDLPPETPVLVLYKNPVTPPQREVFSIASESFRELEVDAYDTNHVESLLSAIP